MKGLFFCTFLVCHLLVAACNPGDDDKMNNSKLEKILIEMGTVKGNEGYWELTVADRMMLVITDQFNNRMRIISPVVEKKDLKKGQWEDILEAQFDRALDVKYALWNDVLWSCFVHPLGELTEEQVKDAVSQVYYAAKNFGTSYVSTDLQFGGGSDAEEEEDSKKK